MTDLTPERLQELRRIAEAATPGPWAWRMSKDGRILDLIALETGYNEEIITPSHINAWLQVKGGLKDFIPAFEPATVLALLDRIEALERQNSEIVLLIIDAITWFYDESTGSVAVDESDRKRGLERLRQVLLMLDPAAAARFPQFYRW